MKELEIVNGFTKNQSGLSYLFEEAKKLDYSQSNGMVCVDRMKGPGFFPGCAGTIDNRQNISGLPEMVLGQDFDTEANHKLIDENKGEIDKNTTWRNLKLLLKDLNIDRSDCFFTNAYMGLRPSSQEVTKNTGQSPAAKRGAGVFANECYEFFKKQLSVVQPETVLVLGKETAKFLSKAFPSEFKKWSDIKTLKSILCGRRKYCQYH